MSETIYWIWLAGRLGPGSSHLHYILDRFQSPYEVFKAEDEELERLELPQKVKEALCNKDIKEAYAISDYCARHNIGIISYDSDFYPERLRMISDPPAVLYFRGSFPDFENIISLGVVGTRRVSEYGRHMAYKYGYELASSGMVIVSGMALGIDGITACGAIKSGGKTVAVLGSGVDVVYPKEHARLYDRIVENGAVISEYPPTTEVRPHHFPVRNRIISGITNGTVVVECDQRSGAMITAKNALEQGRLIFAIPGNIGHKNANGPNYLIQDGAIMAKSPEDIIGEFEFYNGRTINYLAYSSSRAYSQLNEEALAKMGVRWLDENGKLNSISDNALAEKNNIRMKLRAIPENFKSVKMLKTEDENRKVKNNISDIESVDAELSSLDEEERAVFLAMPDDRAVGIDSISVEGRNCSDIMGTLAMLEIKGFISSLPGGLYIKN